MLLDQQYSEGCLNHRALRPRSTAFHRILERIIGLSLHLGTFSFFWLGAGFEAKLASQRQIVASPKQHFASGERDLEQAFDCKYSVTTH